YTLRYRFDAEGIHMRVGLLFRREVNLTYARIQDIHLRSGIIQRWLGLANLQVQTASGSAGPELVIEGFKEFEAIRDFLYTRMRGYQARNLPPRGTAAMPSELPATGFGEAVAAPSATVPATGGNTDVVALLLSIRDELRRARELLESRSASAPAPPRHV
ncbi:MAG TPA: PH domain-containing protein, partial [Candidatus Acidoferrales bacterium]